MHNILYNQMYIYLDNSQSLSANFRKTLRRIDL